LPLAQTSEILKFEPRDLVLTAIWPESRMMVASGRMRGWRVACPSYGLAAARSADAGVYRSNVIAKGSCIGLLCSTGV
jgi:hypothetical protein